jgi:2-phospho-L-lactate guanylyltransferase
VPVKRLSESKTRLRARLSPEGRAELTLWLLGRVVGALEGSWRLGAVYVVTPDVRVAECAGRLGAIALQEERLGLNPALEQARARAIREGATEILAVLADLPLLSSDEVDNLIGSGQASPGAVIAPDRHGTGTNALLVRPPDALTYCFGPRSLDAHIRAARAAGLPMVTYRSRGTAYDVDSAADLEGLSGVLCGQEAPPWIGRPQGSAA